MEKIGFGGSCHWCTEAIFLSIRGVVKVEQGWISSTGSDHELSEAVIVHYAEEIIELKSLIEIHLHTHSCTAQHSMRLKYRSAIYVFNDLQQQLANDAIVTLQSDFTHPIITKVIPFRQFKLNQNKYLNYYYGNREKPFCRNIVSPKLKALINSFPHLINKDKMNLS